MTPYVERATYVALSRKEAAMNSILSILMSEHFIIAAIAFALTLTAIVCLVQIIRMPPFLKRRFDRAVRRCGLRNAQKEYPVLIGVKRDREKPHGLILKVRNKGVSIPDFDRQYNRLKASLNGIIYQMEYGRKADYTMLFFLPQKHVRPALLTPDDEAVGRMSIIHLINILVIGATGTGKTVVIKGLLAKIARFQHNFCIYILDFKMLDFRYLAGLPHYFGFDACIQGLQEVYSIFKQRQAKGVAKGEPIIYLVIDEWVSFIIWLQSTDKKLADQMLKILAELMMLGRGFYIIPIVGAQRPDAAYFASSRDNFQCCLALGNLSREGRRMVFPDEVIDSITLCGKREGHLYIDGVGLEKIRVADIQDLDTLDAIIREAMSH